MIGSFLVGILPSVFFFFILKPGKVEVQVSYNKLLNTNIQQLARVVLGNIGPQLFLS